MVGGLSRDAAEMELPGGFMLMRFVPAQDVDNVVTKLVVSISGRFFTGSQARTVAALGVELGEEWKDKPSLSLLKTCMYLPPMPVA
jgi:hypothetical protein